MADDAGNGSEPKQLGTGWIFQREIHIVSETCLHDLGAKQSQFNANAFFLAGLIYIAYPSTSYGPYSAGSPEMDEPYLP